MDPQRPSVPQLPQRGDTPHKTLRSDHHLATAPPSIESTRLEDELGPDALGPWRDRQQQGSNALGSTSAQRDGTR